MSVVEISQGRTTRYYAALLSDSTRRFQTATKYWNQLFSDLKNNWIIVDICSLRLKPPPKKQKQRQTPNMYGNVTHSVVTRSPQRIYPTVCGDSLNFFKLKFSVKCFHSVKDSHLRNERHNSQKMNLTDIALHLYFFFRSA